MVKLLFCKDIYIYIYAQFVFVLQNWFIDFDQIYIYAFSRRIFAKEKQNQFIKEPTILIIHTARLLNN